MVSNLFGQTTGSVESASQSAVPWGQFPPGSQLAAGTIWWCITGTIGKMRYVTFRVTQRLKMVLVCYSYYDGLLYIHIYI